jgi:hypothetical protein
MESRLLAGNVELVSLRATRARLRSDQVRCVTATRSTRPLFPRQPRP